MIAVISDSVWLALITGMPATLASIATLVNSLKNTNRIREQSVQLTATSQKIDAIHESTNGMKDALVSSTAKASHFEGMADQRAEDKQSRADALQNSKAP